MAMSKNDNSKRNSNGELLLALLFELELILINTMFKEEVERNITWMFPHLEHWYMIIFLITRCWDKIDIHSTQVMRWANWKTNDQMMNLK